MRVLTVIDHLGAGGRQRTAQNYAIGYHRAGHSSAVLTVEKGGPREARLAEVGVPTFIGNSGVPPIMAGAEWKPDVIHVHSEGPPKPPVASAVENLVSALATRVPVIETSSFGKVDYRRRYRKTDVHLLKARWALWRFQKWSRTFTPRPIGVVVPNSVDLDAFYRVSDQERAAFRSRLDVPADGFLFGRVGQPIIWKWSPLIFDAFEEVANRRDDVFLLLVGLPAELRGRLKAMSRKAQSRIREIPFLTSDEDLRVVYTSLDAFLHSAQIGESFGMVLAEALACGCPVIAQSRPSRDNSHLELVGHDRGGLIVNSRSGMIRAMEMLRDDPDLRQRLSVDGAEFVRSTYTLDQIMPRLERIITYAIESSSSSTLRSSLESDPDLVTHVPDAEIKQLMLAALDAPSPIERIKKWAIHQPLIYRPWRAVKFGEY